MPGLRFTLHEHKAKVSMVLMAIGLIVMIMAFYGLPDDFGKEGSGPLASLKAWNYILLFVQVALS